MKKIINDKLLYFILGMAVLTLIYSVAIGSTLLVLHLEKPELKLTELIQILLDRLSQLVNGTMEINKYEFEISSDELVTVSANSKEEARIKVIEMLDKGECDESLRRFASVSKGRLTK